MRIFGVFLFGVFLFSASGDYLFFNDFTCRNGERIPNDVRCDGTPDCKDESDEGPICICQEEEELFRCGHAHPTPTLIYGADPCIFANQVCNGIPECWDSSDEIHCNCTESQFKCHNVICLGDYKLVCDGKDDCGDNSDELSCYSNCTVENNLYRCQDGSGCIPLEKVCDQENDCPDSSDEGELCDKTCYPESCENGKCVAHPHLACICDQGFQRQPALLRRGPLMQCEDIDECWFDMICPQSCVNTQGSFSCTCWPGFEMQAGNKSCVPKEPGFTSDLYFSTKEALWRRDLITGSDMKLLEVPLDIHAISADDTFLYWGEGGTHPKVSRMRLTNTSSVERISIRSIGSVEGIAVDWWTGNVYLTDGGRKEIVVLGDASHKSVSLLGGALQKPRDIALHPQSGRMFWTDWGDYPYVGAAQMDGNGFSRLAEGDIQRPNGLSIDYPSARIYWVDSTSFALDSVRLDGGLRWRVPFYGTVAEPFGLQVMDSSVFYTDKTKLLTMDKFTGRENKTVFEGKDLLSIYSRNSLIHTKPMYADNPCRVKPCSYMCLLSIKGTRSCVDGFTKAVNHQHGERYRLELLVGYTDELCKMGLLYGSRPMLIHGHRINCANYTISKLAHSIWDHNIFVADNEQKKILRVAPHHSQEVITELATEPIGQVSSLMVHPWAQNVYWTDSERRTVEVFSLRTNIQRTMMRLSRENVPMHLEMSLVSKDLFLLTKNRSKLTMIRMDGDDKSVHQLNTEIGENQTVQMMLDDAESLVYLMVGNRLIAWHCETYEEIEIESNLSPSTIHAAFFKGTGELIRTSNDGAIYWRNQRLSLRDSLLELQDKKNPDEMPILITTISSLRLDKESPLCLTDNGGCSDICTLVGKSKVNHCGCGNGRQRWHPNMVNEMGCIPGGKCDYQCPDGECIENLEVCDGLPNCEWGEDERNCTQEQRMHYYSKHLENLEGGKLTDEQMNMSIEVLKEGQKGNGFAGTIITFLSVILVCTVLGFSIALFHKAIRKAFAVRRVNSMARIAFADCMREDTDVSNI